MLQSKGTIWNGSNGFIKEYSLVLDIDSAEQNYCENESKTCLHDTFCPDVADCKS